MRQDKLIASWQEFVGIVSSLDVGTALSPAYAYRGHGDAEYGLTPSMLRHLNRLGVSPEEALKLEDRAWREFLAQAHLHLSPNLYSTMTGNMMNWWTVMQHHRAPTRLLDWTQSIYVAAYFAVASQPDKDGAVWILHTKTVETAMAERFGEFVQPTSPAQFQDAFLRADAPPHVVFARKNTRTDRMIAQQGLFTVCRSILGDHGQSIENVVGPREPKTKGHVLFGRLTIPARLKLSFLARLKTMNIASSSLFPGLDGIGRSITELVMLANT